jgi:PAS domain S-box-containing protein
MKRSKTQPLNELTLIPLGGAGDCPSADAAWQAGEERRRFFRANPSAIVLATLAEGRIVDANDRFLSLLGYAREQVIGRTLTQLDAWLSPGQCQRIGHRLREGQTVRDEEIAYRIASGQARDGRISVEPIELGGERCALAILEDITDAKRAKLELSQAKELLETVFSSIDVGVAYSTSDFNIIRVNRAFAAAGGRPSPEDYAGQNYFALYPNPEDEVLFRRVIETGHPFHGSARPYENPEHPEQGVSYWDLSLQSTKDETGKVIGLVLSQVNVTDRIRTQQALQETAERLRHVVSNAPILLWAINAAGIHTMLEGSLKSHLRLDRLDLIGQSVWEWSRTRPDLQQTIRRAFRGEPVTADFEWMGHVLETHFSPARNEQGEIVGILGVSTDITERRRAEECTRQLAREMILLQEDDRRRISRELYDDTIQTMAATKINLESLLTNLKPESEPFRTRVRHEMALLDEAIARVRSLAGDLRPPALDTFGLDASLESLCDNFAQRSGIHIEYTSPNLDGLTDTYATLLYRFVQEALSDAAKQAHAGRVRVALEKNTREIAAIVEDDGRVEETSLVKGDAVFDKGEEFEPATPLGSPRPMSSGLHRMQDRLGLLGGKLEIRSRPGRGCRLIARLPLRQK